MASRPPFATNLSPRHLMSFGMFVFGLDTAAYQSLRRSREWRHATSERHGVRDAAQYIGPGQDTIELAGLLVPELGARYSSLQTLAAMADTGNNYPLMDGTGRILGHYRIVRMDEDHLTVMAGGIPRHVDFAIQLQRAADDEITQESA